MSESNKQFYKSTSNEKLNSKRGKLKRKSFWSKWKEAFFVLESSFLMEFKNEGSGKPVKVVSLQNFHLRLAENLTGSKYSFALFPDSKVGKDPMFFLAQSETELVEWVSSLIVHCKSHQVEWQSEDQKVMDAFNDAVVMSSDSGIIIGTNNSALELFGYKKGEIIGKNITILMPASIAEGHDVYMKNYFATGIKRLIGKPRELAAVRSDKSPVRVVLSLGEIVENGSIKFIATFRASEKVTMGDITQHTVNAAINDKIEEMFQKCCKELKKSITEDTMPQVFEAIDAYRNRNAELAMQVNRFQKSNSMVNLRKSSEADQTKMVINLSNIQIGERLSDTIGGSGAIIYSCCVDGWLCAMKEFNLEGLTQSMMDSVETEILLLESLPIHKNLVRYLFHRKVDCEGEEYSSSSSSSSSSFSPSFSRSPSSTSFSGNPRVQLFMTKYSTHLTSVIRVKRKEGSFFSLGEIVKYSLDIVKGIEVLHQHNIIHRDLKSDNVFVTLGSGGVIDTLVIGDFDTAKIVTPHENAKTTLGTPGFIAPEVLASKNKNAYSFKVDIWSFGMILYEMMTLKRPFEEKNMFDMIKLTEKGYLPSIPNEIEEKYHPIMGLWKRCLAVNPSDRPTSTEAREMIARLL